jgi:hypothetical protein
LEIRTEFYWNDVRLQSLSVSAQQQRERNFEKVWEQQRKEKNDNNDVPFRFARALLRSLHFPEHARLRQIGHVDENVVGGMTVERSTEPLLVQMVSDESNAPTEDKQSVERANLDILVCLFGRERPTIAQQIDKAHRDASVHVQDERILLGRGHFLNRERIIEQAMAWEMLNHILLHQFDS